MTIERILYRGRLVLSEMSIHRIDLGTSPTMQPDRTRTFRWTWFGSGFLLLCATLGGVFRLQANACPSGTFATSAANSVGITIVSGLIFSSALSLTLVT
jgi:hypothetical protein